MSVVVLVATTFVLSRLRALDAPIPCLFKGVLMKKQYFVMWERANGTFGMVIRSEKRPIIGSIDEYGKILSVEETPGLHPKEPLWKKYQRAGKQPYKNM